MVNEKPLAYADVRLATGEQGSGKSTITVGFAVGDYVDHLTGLKLSSGETIKAQCINKGDILTLKNAGIRPNKVRYIRIFSDDGSQSKIIKIPSGSILLSPVHIFSNFTLYGVVYSPVSLVDIIQYINTDLFDSAWILSDESGMTDSRRSMEAMGKLGTEFYATIRKRHAHFCVNAQVNDMVEKRIRYFATTRVECSFDEESYYITCDVKKRGESPFSFDFYAPDYWTYFDTDEKPKVPQYKIDKALEKVY